MHNDLRPDNIGVSSHGFYIFDLGSASLLNDGAGPYTFPCSLLYSSTCIMRGTQPTVISDVEMLLYVLIKLAGRPLPWEEAAAEGDRLGCFFGRMQLAHCRELPEAILSLPFPLPAFAKRVLRCVADEGSTSWLAPWVAVLSAAADRQ
jgi:hypothetical protein